MHNMIAPDELRLRGHVGWAQLLLLLLLLLLKTTGGAAVARASCSLGTATANNLTASSALLTWSSGTCAKDVVSYSLEVSHQSWMACPEPNQASKNESGSVDYSVSVPQLQVTRLYPYSSYIATIKGLAAKGEMLAEIKVEFQTEMDVPDTRPLPASNSVATTYQRAVKFVWAEEDPAECIHRNGRMDGHLVELFGVDPWVAGPLQLENDIVQGTQFYAGNLLPYTSYRLRVYNRNIGNLVNRQIYLDIQERTLPTRPDTPGNLSLRVISERSIFLSWSPAYPHTGLIEKYELRIGELKEESEEASWQRPVNVSVGHHQACPDSHNKSLDQLMPGHVIACYVVDNLKPSTLYVFQVRTWNLDVGEPSQWSVEASQRTDSLEYSTEVITFPPLTEAGLESTPTLPNADLMGSNHTLIVILCVAGAVAILLVIVILVIYKLKIARLKARLRLQQSISESNYTPSGSTHTQGTMYSGSPQSFPPSSPGFFSFPSSPSSPSFPKSHSYLSTPTVPWDIQSRRLPEPPPQKTAANGDAYYTEAYEMPKLPQGYLDMSPSRRASRPEGEDVEGYLRPTFPHRLRYSEAPSCESQDSDYVSENQEVGVAPAPIPLQSYGHAGGSADLAAVAHARQSADGESDGEPGEGLLERPSGSFNSQNSRTSSRSSKRYSPSEPLVISEAVNI